ncbi:NADH dehydrogenase [ubiquinone] flavoprotein 3, mitochondrial isoform X4 [Mauremys mutica]|uniref:NADH dehydrogenase [ubiquinone] flavoprotein 3, mitochondrial isoform X4 n=1 Tax=Mauremys mutica TaxID=74926 RepID=UPI001D13AA23|nr:NADH dehydrogenase [ubiquinone] flavoprotein 3, mitochondrial isoform X4 [Mauremys mutica]
MGFLYSTQQRILLELACYKRSYRFHDHQLSKGGSNKSNLIVLSSRTLQLEAWGLRSLSPSLSLCTKSEGSKKSQEKNVVAPQESTKLLATKTTVEFPKKLFPSSHPPSANKVEIKIITSASNDEALKLTDEEVRKFLSRKTLVAFPERVTLSSLEGKASITRRGGLSKKLAEEESSSSSESDSSSDSDEEDSASEISTKTRVEFPRRDPFFFENRTVKVMTLAEESLSEKGDEEYIPKKKPRPEFEVPHIKQMESGKTATANSKILKSETREPSVKQSPKGTDLQKSILKTQAKESQKPTAVRLKESRHLAEPPIGAPPAAAQLKVPPGPQREVEQKLTLLKWEETKTREVQETEIKEKASPKLQEEFLKETPFMVNTTTEEEIIQEAGAQTEEQGTTQETKTAAASAQEEFDNSTYKNLQHHEYNMYTFVDFDVELSQFRQPQPSSGRLSPRH